MASRMQTIKKTTIPPRKEVALSCCLTLHNYAPEGLIKGLSDKVVVANSINRPGAKGNVIVRCINLTNQPLEQAAVLSIEIFTSIDEQDITEDGERQLRSEICTLTTSKVQSGGYVSESLPETGKLVGRVPHTIPGRFQSE